MKRALLRFGKGFKVRVNHRRSQAATMTLARGEREGDPGNTHRGADQWLFVVRGMGTARVNGKPYPLRPGTLLLIERGDRHEIIAERGRLETLNIYIPPAYTAGGDEQSAARRGPT
jgi:mannose-6-phosphate isomerase-like protein (cupin superfamily)